MMIWRNTFVAFSVALAGGVLAQGAASSMNRVFELSNDSPIALGRGVTSLNGDVRGDCLDFSPMAIVAQTGQLVSYQAKLVSSRREFQDFMEASASVQAGGISGWNASASATYSNQVSINSYDVNYIVKVAVQNVGENLSAVLLKPSIIARISSEAAPLRWFLETCGDGYVARVISGGELIANIALSTQNTQETTKFSAQLKGAAFGYSANGDFSKVTSALQANNSLSIAMFRTGGTGLELPSNLDELTAQVKSFPSKISSPNAIPRRAVIQSYLSVQNLPNVIRLPLNQNGKSLRNLVDSYNQVRDEIDRINFITSNPTQFYLDPFDIPVLASEVNKLKPIVDNLKDRIDRCVSKNEACHEQLPGIPSGKVFPGRK
jgi:hypothetical protein